ncbi:Carboxypeptidase Y [Hondaea fermentalgiana]|uniref:Carboxypeptidase Y n=1 Tax=Hondaea fermentalgiana TaxID=2315210 RepID=A0A2R5GQT0_9STRA|nr:Carboxypeptidase Y [Hondaea fermentalgiana]|eukprot:GBG30711.1 Carboxypeptidase Y [Hondaea fermentalgiana]
MGPAKFMRAAALVLAAVASAMVSAEAEGRQEVSREMVKSTLASRRAGMNLTITLNTLGGRAELGPEALGANGLEGEENLCDPNVGQVAGYLTLAEQNKHYFFWFFESRNKPESDPVAVWLTGGPGCSGMVGLFNELGPCKVNKDGASTHLNPNSWNANANMVFIDQPGETGFSYGDGDIDEAGVSMDLYIFITEFMKKFDKYSGNDFYTVGESYGGHYVPAFANRIFNENKDRAEGVPHINLKGFGVGNGLTDPVEQYKYYAQMAFNSTTAPSRVSERVYHNMVRQTSTCIDLIAECNTKKHPRFKCQLALMECNQMLVVPYTSTGYNVYDMRVKCEVPPLCYDFSEVDKYLNSARVQKYLGVQKKWESCNMQVNQQMSGDFERRYQQLVPPMLEAGIRGLIYAGDCDYICNWLGNRAWTMKLPWSGQDGFNDAGEKPWMVGDSEAGKARSHGPFTFLQVYQAGHMVPLDQPEAAKAMFETFISGGSFP